MSHDTIRPLGSTRPELPSGGGQGHPTPRPSENPLVKGLIVLIMLAVATTVLVATRDGDEPTTVAASSIESEPLGPVLSDDEPSGTTTPSTVADAADDAPPWPSPQAMGLSSGAAIERLRREARARDTTTTEAPTTTASPTTASPTTGASTEGPGSTGVDETSTSTDGTTSSTDTSSTDTSDPGTTETTTDGTTSSTDTSSTDTSDPGTTETTDATTTTAPTTTAAPATNADPDGWVDSGNGVMVPPVLLAIRYCESRGDYQAANRSSSARGAYQFLTGSWAAYGHAARYGVSQAHLATNAQQDEAAVITWQKDGTRPWNASKSCWSARI